MNLKGNTSLVSIGGLRAAILIFESLNLLPFRNQSFGLSKFLKRIKAIVNLFSVIQELAKAKAPKLWFGLGHK